MYSAYRLFLLVALLGVILPLWSQNSEHPQKDSEEKMEDLPALPAQQQGAAIAEEVRVGETDFQNQKIPHILLQPIYKYPPLELNNNKDREQYNRLVANVKKLLPIAKMVRITVVETYEYLETLPDKKAKQAHINKVEKDLKKEYSPMLSNLTRSQGRLLVKLIDRECGTSGYHIAQAFIGSFRANIYQGLGFIIGLNLNKKYDAQGDDRFTERVIRLVEAGQI